MECTEQLTAGIRVIVTAGWSCSILCLCHCIQAADVLSGPCASESLIVTGSHAAGKLMLLGDKQKVWHCLTSHACSTSKRYPAINATSIVKCMECSMDNLGFRAH